MEGTLKAGAFVLALKPLRADFLTPVHKRRGVRGSCLPLPENGARRMSHTSRDVVAHVYVYRRAK